MGNTILTPSIFNEKYIEMHEDVLFDDSFDEGTPYVWHSAEYIKENVLNCPDPFVKPFHTAWKKMVNRGKKKEGYSPSELIALAMTWEYFAKKYKLKLPFKI